MARQAILAPRPRAIALAPAYPGWNQVRSSVSSHSHSKNGAFYLRPFSFVDGPQSANLGIYQSYSYDPLLNVISFNYEGGDSLANIPRGLIINLTCNPTAGLLTTTGVQMASSGHAPNKPWMYGISAQTALMCMSE